MKTYIYKAKKGPSEIITGEMFAESQSVVLNKLNEMNYHPISVWEKKDAGLRDVSLFSLSGRIKAKDVDLFTISLASLMRAKVPMLDAMKLLHDQTSNKKMRGIVLDMIKNIKDGKMLSQVLNNYPKQFSPLYVNMVRSGEMGGVLEESLDRLAQFRERDGDLRRKISSALAYPILMLIVGVGTVFVMLTFFLPKLLVLFDRLNQELPLPTQILLAISRFLQGQWYWIVFAFLFIAVLIRRFKKGTKRKIILDVLKLRVPIVRDFMRKAEIVKFSRSLGLLLKNGVPIHQGMELTIEMLDNEVLKKELRNSCAGIVKQGMTLTKSLEGASNFPVFARSMIGVGEGAGRLEESLNEIAKMYEKEVEQILRVITTLIEPLLILFIGAVVGFIVFAMMLPIFNIGVMGK